MPAHPLQQRPHRARAAARGALGLPAGGDLRLRARTYGPLGTTATGASGPCRTPCGLDPGLDRVGRLHQAVQVGPPGIDALAVEHDPGAGQDLAQLLELPLVDLEERGVPQPFLEGGGALGLLEEPDELGAPEALRAAGRQHDRPPFGDHGQRRRQPLHRLVEGQVQGVAGAGGDHDRYRLLEPRRSPGLDEGHPFGVGLLQVAGEDPRHLPAVVHGDVEGEVHPGPQGDLEGLPVKRIALDHPFRRPGVPHQLRPVEHAYRVDAHDPGADRLASPGVSRHQVRLDQGGGDLEIGLDVEPVDPDRRPGRGPAEVDQAVAVPGPVVLDPVVRGHPRPHEADELLSLVRPVQTGADQEGDRAALDPGLLQGAQQRRQDEGVRDGPRDVGDDDAGAGAPPGQPGEGGGADRLLEGLLEPGVDILEGGDVGHVQDQGLGRDLDVDPALPVVEPQAAVGWRQGLSFLRGGSAGSRRRPPRCRGRRERSRRRRGSR